MNYMIPRIIHQIWIGDLPRPVHMMNTWLNKHPGFEYRLWTDDDLRRIHWECSAQIGLCRELCGIADIMRLEILFKYGGVFMDADSICIEPLDDFLLDRPAFAAFESETERPGLIANGAIGFCAKHPLLRDMIDNIKSGQLDSLIPSRRAWEVLGPVLLSQFLRNGKYGDVSIFPSHYFFPEHHTKTGIYNGHKKVYAYQVWGTSNQSYSTIGSVNLPKEFDIPTDWVSVLITSYNTPLSFLRECLDSIRAQSSKSKDNFGMEIVWINDGSNGDHSLLLEKELERFRQNSRFCRIVYLRTDLNRGVAAAANDGLKLCTYDIVIKMDADDIMLPNRVYTQMNYMKTHPECQVCGAQIKLFNNTEDGKKKICGETAHPEKVTYEYVKKHGSRWFANHPAICFRKSQVQSIGGYSLDAELKVMHDYELLVRLLRVTNTEIHNLKEVLLLYRLHGGQLTHGLDVSSDAENLRKRILMD